MKPPVNLAEFEEGDIVNCLTYDNIQYIDATVSKYAASERLCIVYENDILFLDDMKIINYASPQN